MTKVTGVGKMAQRVHRDKLTHFLKGFRDYKAKEIPTIKGLGVYANEYIEGYMLGELIDAMGIDMALKWMAWMTTLEGLTPN